MTLTDEALGGGSKSGDWLEYLVAPQLIAEGSNRFEFVLRPETQPTPTIEDPLLWVRYKK